MDQLRIDAINNINDDDKVATQINKKSKIMMDESNN